MTVNVTNTVGANNTIVLDGSSKIPAIDGSQVTALSATAFTTGTLATARIDAGTSGANKILQLDGNAKIPAISGANLTNAPGATVSTSDPTVSSNLTLGKKWVNKTSGEVYICTDATAGANVWTNVGAGSGDVKPYHGAASLYGFCASGTTAGPTWPNVDRIDKFALTSSANATDVGNVTVSRRNIAGGFSAAYGYGAGGDASPGTIEKWSHTTDGNATNVGDLLAGPTGVNVGCSSTTHGYVAGGDPTNNVIQKYSFTTDGNAADVGDLTRTGWTDHPGGNQSSDYGYVTGGSVQPRSPGQAWEDINKWAFASDGNATDIGNLTVGTWATCSNNSSTYGYTAGGATPALGRGNVIDKFSFATDGNATDVGDLSEATQSSFGISSSTHGYVAGGTNPDTSHNVWTRIDKYSFSSDGNAVDTTADLTLGRCLGAQSQV